MKRSTLKGRDRQRSQRFVVVFKKLLARSERPIDRVSLAREIEVAPSLISLILSQERHPTPAFVGRLCRHSAVSAKEALALITAHLQDVAEEALPSAGALTVSQMAVKLKDRREKRGTSLPHSK